MVKNVRGSCRIVTGFIQDSSFVQIETIYFSMVFVSELQQFQQ